MQNTRINNRLLAIFSLYIFPFAFKGGELLNYLFLYGIATIYVLLNLHLIIPLFKTKYFVYFSTLFTFFFLYNSAVIMTSLEIDLSYFSILIAIMRNGIKFLFLACLVIRFHSDEKDKISLFIKYVIASTVFYVFVSIIFAVFPNIKSIWFNIISINQRSTQLLTETFGYQLRLGWDGFAGFRSTLQCTIAIAMLQILQSKNRITNRFYFLSLIFLLLGNLFYGRIGIIISLLILLVSFFLNSRDFFKYIKYFTFSALAILSIGYLLVVYFNLGDWLTWMSTPFVNFFKTGDANNHSINTLRSNYASFNPSLSSLILGEGVFSMISDDKYSDVGWIRLIYQCGMIGLMTAYTQVILTSYMYKSYSRTLIFFMLTILFSFEFKGDIYYELIPLNLAIGLLSTVSKNKSNRSII